MTIPVTGSTDEDAYIEVGIKAVPAQGKGGAGGKTPKDKSSKKETQ